MRIQSHFFAFLLLFTTLAAIAEDWNQWRGNQRDGVWRERGIVESFGDKPLKPVWRAPISSGFSGPTVADGRVYAMDKITEPQETERVLCFNEKTGKPLWEYSYTVTYDLDYGYGPRSSVTVNDGAAFSLGAMGYAVCLDAKTGDVRWERDLKQDYDINVPMWGISASPLVYENHVIYQVGGANGACLVALDVKSGKEVWRALDERTAYSSPVLIQQGGKNVLVCWTADSFSGLNPSNGELVWTEAFRPARLISNIMTPVFDGEYLFFSSFYDGSFLFRVNHDTMSVEKVWARGGRNERNTDALHCMISTPVLTEDYIYGLDSHGELRCLDKMTGDRVWEDLTAVEKRRWATLFLIQHESRYIFFTEAGELILGALSPRGFHEIDRTKIIEPTSKRSAQGETVVWVHPAFANQNIYIRNDKELLCYSLKR